MAIVQHLDTGHVEHGAVARTHRGRLDVDSDLVSFGIEAIPDELDQRIDRALLGVQRQMIPTSQDRHPHHVQSVPDRDCYVLPPAASAWRPRVEAEPPCELRSHAPSVTGLPGVRSRSYDSAGSWEGGFRGCRIRRRQLADIAVRAGACSLAGLALGGGGCLVLTRPGGWWRALCVLLPGRGPPR